MASNCQFSIYLFKCTNYMLTVFLCLCIVATFLLIVFPINFRRAPHRISCPVKAQSLCPLFFIKFLFFTKWYPFKNYEKCILFHLKSSFRSRVIQIFVYASFPYFLPVSHCFRSWFKKNLKVYGVIKCLNKTLITHVWYLEKEIRCVIETLPIDRVLNTTFLWKKHTENVHQKVT